MAFRITAATTLLLLASNIHHVNAKANLDMCGPQFWFGHAMSGDTEQVATCLESLASQEGSDAWLKQIEAEDEVGCTAVVLASINDNLETIKYLAAKGANLSAKCWSGTTALIHAAKNGFTDIVKFLYESGVDVFHKLTTTGWTAITYAARYGRVDTLKFLHKVDMGFSAKNWKGNGVMWAAGVGDVELIQKLLDGPEAPGVNDADAHGLTAAYWATQNGKLKSLHLLKERGADLSLKSPGKMSLLSVAAFNGHVELCVYLLEQGADVDDLDISGWSPIMWASLGGKLATVKVLEDAGACIKPKQGRWDSVMVAATSGHKDIIDWFLARGHSFTGMNHEGKSASKIAQENGHHSVADMLKKMWEINQWHAKKTNAGYTDAAARERALRRQAEKIAAADIEKQHGSGVPDIHVVDAIFETLQQEDADKERIVRLREQQILGDKSKAKLARSRNEHQDL